MDDSYDLGGRPQGRLILENDNQAAAGQLPLQVILMSISISLYMVVYFYTESVLSFVVYLPLVSLAVSKFNNPRVGKAGIITCIFFYSVTLLIFLGNMGQPDLDRQWNLLQLTGASLLMAAIAIMVSSDDARTELEAALAASSVLLFVFLCFVAWKYNTIEDYTWDRWNPGGMQPNWWGELSLFCGLAALLQRHRLIALVQIAFCGYFMFLTQSRGAILALSSAMACYVVMEGFRRRRNRWIGPAGLVLIALVAFMVTPVRDFVTERVFLLNDVSRGMESGISGRLDQWLLAFNLTLQRPLLGNGYGATDAASQLALGYDVHNGFLVILSDFGIPFGVVIILFMSWSWLYWIRKRIPVYSAFSVGLFFYLMTYPRSFNVSSMSILIYATSFLALQQAYTYRGRQQRRAGQPVTQR